MAKNIVYFKVLKLFGQYNINFPIIKDYELSEINNTFESVSDLFDIDNDSNSNSKITLNNIPFMLIGENGTGKSTILKLLYCLSTSDYLELLKYDFESIELSYEHDRKYEEYALSYEELIPNFEYIIEELGMDIFKKSIAKRKLKTILIKIFKDDPQKDILIDKLLFEMKIQSKQKINAKKYKKKFSEEIPDRIRDYIKQKIEEESCPINFFFLDGTIKRTFLPDFINNFTIDSNRNKYNHFYDSYEGIENKSYDIYQEAMEEQFMNEYYYNEEDDEYYHSFDDSPYEDPNMYDDYPNTNIDQYETIEYALNYTYFYDFQKLLKKTNLNINKLISDYHFKKNRIVIQFQKAINESPFIHLFLAYQDHENDDYLSHNLDIESYEKIKISLCIRKVYSNKFEDILNTFLALSESDFNQIYEDIYVKNYEIFEFFIVPFLKNNKLKHQYQTLKFISQDEIKNNKFYLFILLSLFKYYNDYIDNNPEFNDSKILLLEKLINKYLVNKTIKIYPKTMVVKMQDSYIALNELSTGETNLIFMLIMTVLLNLPFLIIDEPEVSMSIAWQKDLLIDLISNSKTRLIISTHSPFIVEDHRLLKHVVYVEELIENE